MITTARVSSECNANIISYFFRSKSASKNRDSQSQKKEGTKNANKQKNEKLKESTHITNEMFVLLSIVGCK